MAQMVISHSGDKDLVDFFSKAVKSTKVKTVFEEFEMESYMQNNNTQNKPRCKNELFSYAIKQGL